MPIPASEVREGFYFARKRDIVRIAASDRPFVDQIAGYVDPIPLKTLFLSKLGFTSDYVTGVCVRAYQGMEVFLKPIAAGVYVVQFGNQPKVRIVKAIHEVQDYWQGNFGDILTKPGPTPPPGYQKQPPPPAASFYLTTDYRYVLSPKDFATFEVIEKDYGASFMFAGRAWALQVHAGMPAHDTIFRALEWLKKELEQIGYNYT